MSNPNEEIDLVFIDDVSKRGTAIKYIEFKDSKFRLSETQKEVIKEICQVKIKTRFIPAPHY